MNDSARTFGFGQQLTTISTERQGPVLHITLSRPERGNAITETTLDELWSVLGRPDETVRVIVLSGAGQDFCLGGDREEFSTLLDKDPTGDGVRISGTKARQVCEAITGHHAVTIARVHGKTIGAGLALTLACDLRIGTDTSSFRLPELALGLPTAWGGLLPRLLHEIGAARAREIILTSRAIDAAEALSLSILQKVVPEQQLDQATSEWIKPILRRPDTALRVTKTLMNAYTTAARLADLSALDAELMASVLASSRYRASTM